MKTAYSPIPLSYKTIKVTQGRIDKGLLAIPVSLIDLFPKERGIIYFADNKGSLNKKSFSPYSSSTREIRIGGLKEFYNKYAIKNGDELVIQKVDDNVYRLIPEKKFSAQIIESLDFLEKSDDSTGIDKVLSDVAKIANVTSEKIIENEFVKLSNVSIIPERKIKTCESNKKKRNCSLFSAEYFKNNISQ